MPHGLIVVLFLALIGSLAILVKWEYAKSRKGISTTSKALGARVSGADTERAEIYVPPERRRSLDSGTGRR
jgi:hypothetical protein